jgi:hypothetical protein
VLRQELTHLHGHPRGRHHRGVLAGRRAHRAPLPAMAGIAAVATHEEPAHADGAANGPQ